MSGGGGTTTTQQELAPEQQKILDLVFPVLQRSIKQGAQTFEGQRVAPTTPYEQLGQQMVANAAQGPAQGVASSAAGASNFLTSGDVLDVNRNPGLQGAIAAGIEPLQQEFLTSVLPQVRGDAILSGQYGGSEQREATNLAGQNYLRAVGNTTANIVNPAYQAGLDAYTRGLALAPQTAGLQYGPGAALAGVGTAQRAQTQAEIDAEMQRFIENNYGDLLLAQQVAGTAFGIPVAKGVTETQGGTSPLLQALGGGASGAALGSLVAPGVGTGVGAGLGALLAFLGS